MRSCTLRIQIGEALGVDLHTARDVAAGPIGGVAGRFGDVQQAHAGMGGVHRDQDERDAPADTERLVQRLVGLQQQATAFITSKDVATIRADQARW